MTDMKPFDADKKTRDFVEVETADGRAQPGDVIGIETDGERTELGDTRKDEDKRREDAEKAVRKERSERP